MRGILSKPTQYITHSIVIGLSFFVSVSTVYGDTALYASANPQGKKITNKIVNTKVNPRIIANIADVTDAPIEVSQEDLKANDYSYMSSLSLSDNGTVDGSTVVVDAGTVRSGVISYKVEGGDTLWSIASKFGVTTNTVKWANGMSDADSIKPGQTLTILPTSGTVHKVKVGDTLASVASFYSASAPQIVEENGLVGEVLEADQILIIPGGSVSEPEVVQPKQQATPQKSTKLASKSSNTKTSTSGKKVAYGSSISGFPYGQCTYYVASRRKVTWRGNAGAWLSNAAAQGYATGRSPQSGAIVVTNESRVGHVAIVESVGDGYISISEMNYGGRGTFNRRTISIGSGAIRGYIY